MVAVRFKKKKTVKMRARAVTQLTVSDYLEPFSLASIFRTLKKNDRFGFFLRLPRDDDVTVE
jgi:hypothetical protein